MLTIYLKDLVVEAKHGVHDLEKQSLQPFRISIELEVDISGHMTDKVEDTVDWSRCRQLIIDTVQQNSFDLVEKLAQTIADKLLAEKRIKKVKIEIDKLQAFDNGLPGVRLEVSS